MFPQQALHERPQLGAGRLSLGPVDSDVLPNDVGEFLGDARWVGATVVDPVMSAKVQGVVATSEGGLLGELASLDDGCRVGHFRVLDIGTCADPGHDDSCPSAKEL